MNDGRFGATQTWTNCGGGTAQIVQFAARSADGTFGVYALQTVASDDPAIAMVLESVGLVPGATMTPPTIAAGPDLSSTFVLYVQLVDAENTPLAIALASFQLV